MSDCDGKKCFLFDGCPGRTGVCYSCGPDGNECPVYRWFKEKVLKESPQWISVEDELPEKSGRYLVFFGKSIVETMKTAYWLPEKQIWMGAEAYSSLYGITHWMPLPKPPEECVE